MLRLRQEVQIGGIGALVFDFFIGGYYNDPYGFRWAIGQHVRDVTPEEMERAQADMAKQMQQKKTA